MKTRLISIISILVLSATFATAQYPRKISIGILGGVNFQNLYGQGYNGRKLGNEMILGYHAGVNFQIPITRNFCLQPGVLFSTKGTKKSDSTITTIINLSYIEVPLNFVYITRIGSGYLMLGAGPYIGYAINGNTKTEIEGVSQTDVIKFKNVIAESDRSSEPYYKAFDAGGNILFGYEIASAFIQLNIQLGMININPVYKGLPDDKSMVKNTGFGFSLGYRF